VRLVLGSTPSVYPGKFVPFFKQKKLGSKLNYYVKLRIEIGQHSRDKLLIHHFMNLLCYGYVYDINNNNFTTYSVSKFEDIYIKIIPFLINIK
jgi:hypothetical protein